MPSSLPSSLPSLIHSLLQDLRFALRQLRRAPFFSVTVILTVAIAIGATAALAAVLRATLLSTLPYPQPNRLVAVSDENLRGFRSNGLVGVPRAADLATLQQDGKPLFSHVAAFYGNAGQLAPGGQPPLSTVGAAVSGSFFATLGVDAQLGRTLSPADDVYGTGLVLVLSDHLWRTAFAADPHVIGRSVRLGTDGATVIGVMPARFAFPAGADLWYPAHLAAMNFGGYRGEGTRFVQVLARLAATATLDSARGGTAVLAHRLALTYPATDADWAFQVTPLRSSLFGPLRGGLLLLSAAVTLILLVVVVNIAGLQLARNARRAPEFALRSALGISRGRFLAQLATESTLLIGLGSLCGLALAYVSLHVLRSRFASSVVLVEQPHLDLPAILLVCLLTGLVTLFLAVLGAARRPLPGGSGRTVTSGSRRFGRLFSAAQIALTLVLLTLSATVLSSLYRLLDTALGFDTGHVLTCSIDLGWTVQVPVRHRLYEQAEDEIAQLPGVASVGATNALPLTDFSGRATFDIAGHAPTPQHDAVDAQARSFSPGYLRTLRIPLLAGRPLTARDADPNAPPVLAVNQAFARRYFPAEDPVGQHLVSSGYLPGSVRSSEIVAVIADVHGTDGQLDSLAQPVVFSPEDGSWPHMQFAIRSSLPASALEPQIRRLVTGLNATASVGHFTELSSTIEQSLAPRRWYAALFTSMAAVSVLLVMLGIYGLVAFDIAGRTRELALRLALGSTRSGITRLLLRESATLLAAGLGVGLLGSLLGSRLLHALSADLVGPISTLLLLPTIVLLAIAVLLATLLPARRAAAVEPTTALRSE